MKLYGNLFSSCTRKVLITLSEKNVQFDFQAVDLMKGEHKSSEYLTKHPFGVVPYLEDDGVNIYESRAICRYLDRKYPQNPLVPTDLKSLAQMEQWASVEQSYLDTAAHKIFFNRVLASLRGVSSDEAAIAQGVKGVHYVYSILDKALRAQPYLAGESFSLADVYLMPYQGYLTFAKEPHIIEHYPSLHAWWKRVSARPSWKQFEK